MPDPREGQSDASTELGMSGDVPTEPAVDLAKGRSVCRAEPTRSEGLMRIRSAEEQVRVQERLLIRGNTLGGVVSAALSILVRGGEVPDHQLAGLRDDLDAWTADIRAVASEEAP